MDVTPASFVLLAGLDRTCVRSGHSAQRGSCGARTDTRRPCARSSRIPRIRRVSFVALGSDDVVRIRRRVDTHGVSRVPHVGRRPAPCGALREESLAVRATPTPNDPRGHVVRVVAGVTLVVELPFATTTRTRDGRDAGFIGRERVVGHEPVSVRDQLNGDTARANRSISMAFTGLVHCHPFGRSFELPPPVEPGDD